MEQSSSSTQKKILLVGLGHAGTKAVLTTLAQFPSEDVAYAVGDVSNETINQDNTELEAIFTLKDGWETSLSETLSNRPLLVVLTGLGGKTGTEMAKVMLKEANAANVPAMLVATTPFAFEGDQRKQLADKSLAAFKATANATVLIPNDLLFETLPPDTTPAAAFEQADAWMAEAVSSIIRPFLMNNLINTQLDKLDWLLKHKNATCAVGIGWGEGENAVEDAVSQLSACPFLQMHVVNGETADAALAMVTFPEETTFPELNSCLGGIKNLLGTLENVELCAAQDDTVAEGLRIVILMRFTTATKRTARGAKHAPDAPAAAEAAPDAPQASLLPGLVGSEKQQLLLDIREQKTGIFSGQQPTKYGLENLDVPTYIRRNIDLPQ